MLKPVLCSSRDGVPLNVKRKLSGNTAFQNRFLNPISAHVIARWTLPLKCGKIVPFWDSVVLSGKRIEECG
jgi:hypothetical protein